MTVLKIFNFWYWEKGNFGKGQFRCVVIYCKHKVTDRTEKNTRILNFIWLNGQRREAEISRVGAWEEFN